MKRIKMVLFLSLAMIFLVSCNKEYSNKGETKKEITKKDYIKYEDTFYETFDTIVSFSCYTTSEDEFEGYKKIVRDNFKKYNDIFDNYKDYPGVVNVKTINDNPGTEVVVPKELFDLIKFSKESYKNISDRTNIAMGKVTMYWSDLRDYFEDGDGNEDREEDFSILTSEELKNLNGKASVDMIELNEKNLSVKLLNEDTKIDLGAVAKGYTTELVADLLEENGLENFIISAGGNVKAVGQPQDGNRTKFGVGIQNPDNAIGLSDEKIKDVLFINNLSCVTSGDYQRAFELDGKTYHHLIDPDTFYPKNNYRSVTVVTEDSGLADYLSTCLFLLDLDDAKALLSKHEDVGAYFILSDGSTFITENLKDRLESLGAKN